MDSLKDKFKDQSISDSILKLNSMVADLAVDPLVIMFGEKIIGKGLKKKHR